MNRLLTVGIAIAILSGCVSLTPEQWQDRYVVDAQNWENCRIALRENDIKWISRHAHVRGRTHRFYEIKEDLLSAKCRFFLGRYWIDYND